LIEDVLVLYESSKEAVFFKTKLSAEPCLAMADSDRLRQILHNLIRNAIEARKDDKSALHVDLITKNFDKNQLPGLLLTVNDDGPGVKPELLERIFEPYITSKTRGTGLGLAIVKRIVDQHGGSIHIDNLPDGGTEIRLWLPAAIVTV